MRIVVLLVLVMSCGDNGVRPPDAAPRDGAVDAAPDAWPFPYGACRVASDCTTIDNPDCVIVCSPGGACGASQCGKVPNNTVFHNLCDPLSTMPCKKPLTGADGTCQQVPLGMNYPQILVWSCR